MLVCKAIAFWSYYGWNSNYHTVDESQQNLKIVHFGWALAKIWLTLYYTKRMGEPNLGWVEEYMARKLDPKLKGMKFMHV